MNTVVRTLLRAANRAGVGLYRASGGRVGGRVKGAPVLLLTVKGRKSGREFSCPLAYFEHEGGYLVVGSAGGLPEEPQWFKNLRATDTAVVELRDHRRDVAVRVLEGAHRDVAWARIRSETSGFDGYEAKSGRMMPIALLTPR